MIDFGHKILKEVKFYKSFKISSKIKKVFPVWVKNAVIEGIFLGGGWG